MADIIFLDSKITADGDCSHEFKRRLLLGRKVMMIFFGTRHSDAYIFLFLLCFSLLLFSQCPGVGEIGELSCLEAQFPEPLLLLAASLSPCIGGG